MKKLLFILLIAPVIGWGQMSAARKMLLSQTSEMVFVMSMSTISTISTWSPALVDKTGSTLHWEVTGAVTTSADANDPTFDFSTAGTKNITVTSADGGNGLSVLDLDGLSLTALDISGATDLITLDADYNSLNSLVTTYNVDLYLISIESNFSLSSLDLSTNTDLRTVVCPGNSLPKSVVDAMMDDLIGFGLDGNYLIVSDQDPAITPDAAKIAALESLGWTVDY